MEMPCQPSMIATAAEFQCFSEAYSSGVQCAFSTGAVPAPLNCSLITPVFKKGDPFDTANYRPIAVTPPVMRLYAGILNKRLMTYAEDNDLRAESQTGFRPGHSTVHQVFALQHFISEASHRQAPLFTCFLDLTGAYDKVQRPLLWQALQRLGVHGHMLAALQSLYTGSTVRVNISGRMGSPQHSRTGLKQGCPLSPTLFGLLADGLHRYIAAACPGVGVAVDGGHRVGILGYADDFVLIADTPEGLQQLIDAAAEFCGAIGMIISVPKTQTLVFSATVQHYALWHCQGHQLQQVDRFRYLGLLFSAQGGLEATFTPLKQKMFAAWALLKRQYGNLSCFIVCGPSAQGL